MRGRVRQKGRAGFTLCGLGFKHHPHPSPLLMPQPLPPSIFQEVLGLGKEDAKLPPHPVYPPPSPSAMDHPSSKSRGSGGDLQWSGMKCDDPKAPLEWHSTLHSLVVGESFAL